MSSATENPPAPVKKSVPPKPAIPRTEAGPEITASDAVAITDKFLNVLRSNPQVFRILELRFGNAPQANQSVSAMAVVDQQVVEIKFVVPRK